MELYSNGFTMHGQKMITVRSSRYATTFINVINTQIGTSALVSGDIWVDGDAAGYPAFIAGTAQNGLL